MRQRLMPSIALLVALAWPAVVQGGSTDRPPESEVMTSFASFTREWWPAVVHVDTAFVLAHTQFPLPVLTRNAYEGPDGKARMITGTSVRMVTAEEWSKVATCGSAEEIGFEVKEWPAWRCDLHWIAGGDEKSIGQLHMGSADFTIGFGEGMRSLYTARPSATLRFDQVDGVWMLRRIEHVMLAE